MALPLDDPDYALVWPVTVFRDEFSALIASSKPNSNWSSTSTSNSEALELLCREAFAGPALADQIARDRTEPPNPWDTLVTANELHRRLGELREQAKPRPYYNQRSGAVLAGPRYESARRAFARLVADLDRGGYLDQAFQKDCVDDPRDDPSFLLEERLNVAELWPLRPESWDEDVFYSLIEVFHDLVSRPRTVVRWHSWDQCGPHFGTFASKPGRALYVVRVNALLDRNGFNLRLAPDGEDAGRLVAATDEARDDLLERSIASAGSGADDIRHAIRLFRARDATREEKRSAVVALARVLESERDLLKQELLNGDEGALFQIANRFAIRHERADQQSDYDDAYLDWIFWWYLATVELIQSLRQREAQQP